MANKSGQTHDLWTRTRGWEQGPQQLVVPDTHGQHNRARLEDRAIVQCDRISLCPRLKDETRCVGAFIHPATAGLQDVAPGAQYLTRMDRISALVTYP